MAASESDAAATVIELGLPKGRMKDCVLKLLADAGVSVKVSDRGYRPEISLPGYNVKLLKPQNILEMLESGTRDVGFGGLDWVRNLGLDSVVELLDTGMDPVRLVVAAPDPDVIEKAKKAGREIVVASEYERITRDWIAAQGVKAKFVRAFGATESFPPEDADVIIDNTATGATLKANGLHIIDVVLRSSTRMYASRRAMDNPAKRAEIERLVLLVTSALAGRSRCMLEFNVPEEAYEAAVAIVPCMRAPTVAKLFHDQGFAVKAVIPRKDVADLLPRLKAAGASDLIISDVRQVIA